MVRPRPEARLGQWRKREWPVPRCSHDCDDDCRGDEERQQPKAVTLRKGLMVAVEDDHQEDRDDHENDQ